MKKLLSTILATAITVSCCVPAMASGSSSVNPSVTYEVSVTDSERELVHAAVDALSGYNGTDFKFNDGTYDPDSLVGAMVTGGSYDSISYGSRNAGSIPTEYPFAVPNTENNHDEHDRKAAKYAWVIELAEALGLEAVQRQDDKYVYVEIGDPDAPEMIMALSHLDSPTGANNSGKPGGNLSRWVNYEGEFDPTAYHTPYVKDGWVYCTGVQDDSGPTLATLFAAKALKDAGVPFDRRIRIIMGSYEDNNPGLPSVQDTLNYMDIPYYTTNPSFYDNWAYKSLNREETPIAGYTSDSRFPVIIGNTQNMTSVRVTYDLSEDADLPLHLVSAEAGVTLREGDPTLKDIVHGSAAQMASRAIFTLAVPDAEENAVDAFMDAIEDAAEDEDAVDASMDAIENDAEDEDPVDASMYAIEDVAENEDPVEAFMDAIQDAAEDMGWLPTEKGTTPKVAVTYNSDDNTVVLEINTGVAMEYPTPQYGKNAVVWGMYLLSKALPNGLELKDAAQGITDLFFPDGEEGESYIGKYFLPNHLLRNQYDGAPNMTFALMGNIGGSTSDSAENLVSFYSDGTLSMNMSTRQMFDNERDYNQARQAVESAFEAKGYTLTGLSNYSACKLYLTRDNLLTALQFASYQASIEGDPEAFEDVYDLLDISSPIGTTGGTLATNFRNKMTAFGAIIPGNERWWHSANERMKVDSVVEMTKLMADGMLEMARYSGPAGAQLMWADIDGYNADRADLDLLDVTVATYQDASDAITSDLLDDQVLLGATKFDIPMWTDRGNTSFTAQQYALGHESGGCYLPLDNADYVANTFVLPMRLEFKVERSSVSSTAAWNKLVKGDVSDFDFNLLTDEGEVIALTLPTTQKADADKFYSIRVPDNDDDTIYVSVNLAIVDGEEFDGVETVLADSRTDLYKLSETYLANGGVDYFPERTAATEERGFFLFGDGAKDAEFTSPAAIYVTTDEYVAPSGGGSSSGGSGPVTYTVTTPSSVKNGSVSVSPKNASKGSTVTITVKPDDGYELDELTVTDKNGDIVKLSRQSATKYTFTMPASKVTIQASFVQTSADTSWRNPFSDVSGSSWYYDAVSYVEQNGLMSGMTASSFSPSSTLTRAMLAQVLYNYDSAAQAGLSGSFTDVASGAWYADAVLWAAHWGVVSGYGDGRFGPEAPITREQMATVLYNYAVLKGYDTSARGSLATFTDADSISSYAVEPMRWAVAHGLFSGMGDGTLNPGGSATRAEVASILMNFCENIAK